MARAPGTDGRADPGAVSRGSRFFAVSAMAIAALVLLSFPLTYFGPLATGSRRFNLLHHGHGLAFFAWVGLYVVQTRLVRSGKIRLHRELGIAGVALAGAMVPLGLWMAVTAAAARRAAGVALPFEFSLYNIVDLGVFAFAFGWAIHEASRRIEWHRRLMFVALLNLFGPAFSRWMLKLPLPFPWVDMSANLAADLLLFALAWHDRRRIGHVHPVTLGAALSLIPFHAVEPLIARSAAWNAVAPSLLGFGSG